MPLDLPENFGSLHKHEETIRAQSIEAIKASENFLMHAALIEHTMSLLKYFIQVHQSSDEDVRTVQLLGIRLFNAAASVWKLLLSGYHQTSALQQRDMLETIFLLDYFCTDQSLIADWRNSTDKVRRKKFGPVAVRTALDERDGSTTGKRDDAYKMFCEFAAHPTYLGFHMLTDKKGGDIYTGPFFEISWLKAGLDELARHLALAGSVFVNLFPPQSLQDLKVRRSFVDLHDQWAERFLGRPIDRSNIGELQELAQAIAKG